MADRRSTTGTTKMQIELPEGPRTIDFTVDGLADINLSTLLPVRTPPRYEQMRSWVNNVFSVTTGDFITAESLIEMRGQLVLDSDPTVVAIIGQPCKLVFPDGTHHTPDALAVLDTGGLVLVDYKSATSLARAAEQFDNTREAAGAASVAYAVLTELPLPVRRNLKWAHACASDWRDLGIMMSDEVDLAIRVAGSGVPFEHVVDVLAKDGELGASAQRFCLAMMFMGRLAPASWDTPLQDDTVVSAGPGSSRWNNIRHPEHQWSRERIEPEACTEALLPSGILVSDLPDQERHWVDAQQAIIEQWEQKTLPHHDGEPWEMVSHLLWAAEIAAKGRTDIQPPSRASVFRKRASYRAGGWLALIDGRTVKPTREPHLRYPVFTEELRRQFVKPGTTRSNELLIRRAEKQLNKRSSKGDATETESRIPCRTEKYQILETVRAVESTGPTVTSKSVRMAQASNRNPGVWDITRPGEIIMLDASPANSATVTGEHEDRDNRLVAYDACTGMVVAMDTGETTENASRLVNLLTQMAGDVGHPDGRHSRPSLPPGIDTDRLTVHVDDTSLAYATDEQGNEFRLFPAVKPEAVVIDGGPAFQSRAFKDACRKLGITIINAAPKRGSSKPHVERLFGLSTNAFEQHLDEYLGRNAAERGPNAMARSHRTPKQLHLLALAWAGFHHNRAEQTYTAKLGQNRVRVPRDVMFDGLCRQYATGSWTLDQIELIELFPEKLIALGPRGFELHGLRYDRRDDVLVESLRGGQQKIPVKYHAGDVSRVWIRHPDGGWRQLNWMHAHLLEGQPFSARLKDDLESMLDALDDADIDKRAAGQRRFQEEISQPGQTKKRSRKRGHNNEPAVAREPVVEHPPASSLEHIQEVFRQAEIENDEQAAIGEMTDVA